MHYTNYTNSASGAAPKLYQLNYERGGSPSFPWDWLAVPVPVQCQSLLASLSWPESVTEMLYTDKQQISIVCNLAKLLLLQLFLYAPPGALRDSRPTCPQLPNSPPFGLQELTYQPATIGSVEMGPTKGYC